MKILVLTQVLPYPPDSGPKVKTYHQLRNLAERHTVTVLSFTRGDQAREIANLEALGIRVKGIPIRRERWRDGVALLSSLIGGEPWMMRRDWRPEMAQAVRSTAKEGFFDLVIADQLNMAQYALLVDGTRKILDAHNALWLLYQRLAKTSRTGPLRLLLQRDWKLLKAYEGRVCCMFDAVTAVSDVDRSALQEASDGLADIYVSPITVDTDTLQPVSRGPNASRILSIGTMYWQPNIDGIEWFLREVLPLIRAVRPDAFVEIIGARPPQQLRLFSEKDERILIPGYVEDVSASLKQAGVFIVPLLSGGGMRVKILEALARGLPVVSTTIGAEGIAVTPGKHLLIADEPADFARAVERLLSDPELGNQLGLAGRELIVQQYDTRRVYRELERVYFGDEPGRQIKSISERPPAAV